jgi:class 3 adenylate cyclase
LQGQPTSGPRPDALPTGLVTFLFTDVEGSTRAWAHYPEAVRTALARHDALIEQLVEQHRGQVVRPRGEGDSRFAVFGRASDAVAGACAIQRAFVREAWPTPVPLRIRVALHTGEADLRAGDYYGSAVNRCARLRAIAHGGQLVLSGITADLVREGLPAEVGLRDLGQHRLTSPRSPRWLRGAITCPSSSPASWAASKR